MAIKEVYALFKIVTVPEIIGDISAFLKLIYILAYIPVTQKNSFGEKMSQWPDI